MRSNPCRAAALLGGLLFSTAAWANGPACNLNANQVSGTFGFAGEGVATQNTPFAPQGPVVESGTVTHMVTGTSGQTISGNWSVTLTQNDAAGAHPNVQFGGNFQVNTTTCQADFYVTSPVQLKSPAFHVVFVDSGNELRTASLIPNLYIVYPTAKRL